MGLHPGNHKSFGPRSTVVFVVLRLTYPGAWIPGHIKSQLLIFDQFSIKFGRSWSKITFSRGNSFSSGIPSNSTDHLATHEDRMYTCSIFNFYLIGCIRISRKKKNRKRLNSKKKSENWKWGEKIEISTVWSQN